MRDMTPSRQTQARLARTRALRIVKSSYSARAREAKKSREALASKAGNDPSEFDTLTWCAWLNLNCGYDRNAAAELIVRWRCDAREDHDRVKRALCEVHTRKPPDVEAFMAERLKGLGS